LLIDVSSRRMIKGVIIYKKKTPFQRLCQRNSPRYLRACADICSFLRLCAQFGTSIFLFFFLNFLGLKFGNGVASLSFLSGIEKGKTIVCPWPRHVGGPSSTWPTTTHSSHLFSLGHNLCRNWCSESLLQVIMCLLHSLSTEGLH
jgi:hypothetical protein